MTESGMWNRIMKNGVFYITVIIQMLFSCTPGIDTEGSGKIIDVQENIANFHEEVLSNYAGEIIYIPLETRSDLILNENILFDCNEDYIVTVDHKLALVLYDKRGRFIRSFGSKGRGPEEYQSVSNLHLEKNRILFNSMYDVYEFNIKGEFIGKYPDILRAEDRFFLDPWRLIQDSLIFGHVPNDDGKAPYKALLINMNGEVVNAYTNHDILTNYGSRIPGGTTQIYSFKGNLCFKEEFTDTLFRLTNTKMLVPYYTFNLGKLKVPEKIRSNFFEYFASKRDYIAITNILELEKYLLLEIDFGNSFPVSRVLEKDSAVQKEVNKIAKPTSIGLGIYQKGTGKFVICEPKDQDKLFINNGITNDIDAGPAFFPQKMVNDSTLAMIISAEDFTEYLESYEFKNAEARSLEKKTRLIKLAENINYADNPVLMYVKF
jgi:hypothetical protein